jgi:hypothetical protein
LLEAAASCEIVGVPLPLFRFQFRLRSLAPSARPEKAILLTLVEGDTRLPDASKLRVPALFVGIPVASPIGKSTE